MKKKFGRSVLKTPRYRIGKSVKYEDLSPTELGVLRRIYNYSKRHNFKYGLSTKECGDVMIVSSLEKKGLIFPKTHAVIVEGKKIYLRYWLPTVKAKELFKQKRLVDYG